MMPSPSGNAEPRRLRWILGIGFVVFLVPQFASSQWVQFQDVTATWLQAPPATGTDDFGLMGQRGKSTEAQSEVLPATIEVPRYQMLLEGGDHYFGGLVQKDVPGEPDHEGLTIFNATSTAFLDAQTKASPAAQRYLDQVDLAQVTNQRAQLERSE